MTISLPNYRLYLTVMAIKVYLEIYNLHSFIKFIYLILNKKIEIFIIYQSIDLIVYLGGRDNIVLKL